MNKYITIIEYRYSLHGVFGLAFAVKFNGRGFRPQSVSQINLSKPFIIQCLTTFIYTTTPLNLFPSCHASVVPESPEVKWL